GFNPGTGVVDAATPGTQRAFTKVMMDQGIQAGYIAGGKPTVLMMAPYAKTVFSTFMSDANIAPLRVPLTGRDQATVVGAAGAYVSAFGLVTAVPNRQMARAGAYIARNIFGIDKTKWTLLFLRP